MYPEKFDQLVAAFLHLPGVGAKTAERYAYAVMDWSPEYLDRFVKSISDVKKLKHCKICGNLSDGEICSICSSPARDHSVICVVQTPKNLMTMESIQEYNGVYHVLNGAINTQKGILPEQLNIQSLEDRIDDSVKEVILALDPTVEGETTALYLSRLLEGKTHITKLASGLPVGGHLDYTDVKTLLKAFEGRTKS